MPRRAASVTQADIARAIRALRDAGFPRVRVIMRDGGVTVEPAGHEERGHERAEELADEDQVVVL